MKIVHDEGPTWVVTADPEMEGEGKPSLKN
jgi:hypothetical protein